MHTAAQLRPSSFQYLIGGENADLTGLFPRWTPDDRFGILIDRPLGALGASLLIQAAIAAFYDVRPERRGEAPAYPEIYALHVGGPFGDHSAFDFWPPRKEVVIPVRNPVDILTAVNTHAVTRLAVPDVLVGDVARLEEGPSTWAEQQSAHDRIASCFAYDPGGRVQAADVVLRSLEPRVEENAGFTLNPLAGAQQVLALGVEEPAGTRVGFDRPEDTSRWVERVRARAGEVPEQKRVELARARAQAGGADSAVRTESFRRLSVDEALACIAGLA
ncbi:hypothetical protein [Streptomyces sp. NPDC008122]|uniref:hypothetical protein n=1 Tax=Streptomyces sp. NPDC008122 TaxID=3364810 RepID=UPI0036EA09DF